MSHCEIQDLLLDLNVDVNYVFTLVKETYWHNKVTDINILSMDKDARYHFRTPLKNVHNLFKINLVPLSFLSKVGDVNQGPNSSSLSPFEISNPKYVASLFFEWWVCCLSHCVFTPDKKYLNIFVQPCLAEDWLGRSVN